MMIWSKASAFFLVREKVELALTFESNLVCFIEIQMPPKKSTKNECQPPKQHYLNKIMLV